MNLIQILTAGACAACLAQPAALARTNGGDAYDGASCGASVDGVYRHIGEPVTYEELRDYFTPGRFYSETSLLGGQSVRFKIKSQTPENDGDSFRVSTHKISVETMDWFDEDYYFLKLFYNEEEAFHRAAGMSATSRLYNRWTTGGRPGHGQVLHSADGLPVRQPDDRVISDLDSYLAEQYGRMDVDYDTQIRPIYDAYRGGAVHAYECYWIKGDFDMMCYKFMGGGGTIEVKYRRLSDEIS